MHRDANCSEVQMLPFCLFCIFSQATLHLSREQPHEYQNTELIKLDIKSKLEETEET